MRQKIDPQLLELIRCPVTHSPLTEADPGLIDSLNQEIANRNLVNQIGQTVDQEIDAGLVNADGSLLLPIYNGIVVLISDQAIPIDATPTQKPKDH